MKNFKNKLSLTSDTKWPASLVLSVLLAISCSTNLYADCSPSYSKVVGAGFGDPNNIYMHSMTTYGNDLFVGTFNQVSGAQIWRYDGSTWTRVVDKGLGEVNDQSVRNLIAFGGQLYAGIYNDIDGAEVWRSDDGSNWQRLVVPFTNPDNISVRGFAIFSGYLYVGLQRANDTAQLWRTPDGSYWESVVVDGFGDPTNSSAHFLKVFGGYLYVGTRNSDVGAQLFRSRDGVNFNVVVGPGAATPAGFGHNDGAIFSMEVYKGSLYVGTTNWYQGYSVYKTDDGLNYTRVISGGFGDNTNAYAWRMQVFEDALWLGTMNRKVGTSAARVLRTFDGVNWTEMVGPTSPYIGQGFGNGSNWGVRTLETYKGKLYLGTAQCWFDACTSITNGAEIWVWPGEVCTQ
jgi:flagellin